MKCCVCGKEIEKKLDGSLKGRAFLGEAEPFRGKPFCTKACLHKAEREYTKQSKAKNINQSSKKETQEIVSEPSKGNLTGENQGLNQDQISNETITLKKKPQLATYQGKYPGWQDLTDYIMLIYPPDTVDWMMCAMQIKKIIAEYGLTCDGIRDILIYAIDIEKHQVLSNYGLGQFIPKYILPQQKFVERLQANREIARDGLTDNVEVIKPKHKRKNYKVALEDF